VDHSTLNRLPHRNPILGRLSTLEEQALSVVRVFETANWLK